jgi:hypothetical protein
MARQPPDRSDEALAKTASPDAPSSLDDLLKQVARTPDPTRSLGPKAAAATAPGPFVGRFEITRLAVVGDNGSR